MLKCRNVEMWKHGIVVSKARLGLNKMKPTTRGTWERGSYAEDGGETDEEGREGPYGGRRVAQELVQTPPVRAWFWQALKRRASLTCGHTVRSNRNNWETNSHLNGSCVFVVC